MDNSAEFSISQHYKEERRQTEGPEVPTSDFYEGEQRLKQLETELSASYEKSTSSETDKAEFIQSLAQRIRALEEESNQLRQSSERDPKFPEAYNPAAFDEKVESTLLAKHRQLERDRRQLISTLTQKGVAADTVREVAASLEFNGALAIIDIDHFKWVNDSLGHPAGDDILSNVLKTIKGHLGRGTDLIGRRGGDEISVFMDDITPKGASVKLNEIREAIQNGITPNFAEEMRKTHPDWKQTVSIGFVPVKVGDISAITLDKKADEAAYVAKMERNRVVNFEKKDQVKAEIVAKRAQPQISTPKAA